MEKQDQMREQNMNLHLFLQHLSESDDFLNEWIFVESTPIVEGEHNILSVWQDGTKGTFYDRKQDRRQSHVCGFGMHRQH